MSPRDVLWNCSVLLQMNLHNGICELDLLWLSIGSPARHAPLNADCTFPHFSGSQTSPLILTV